MDQISLSALVAARIAAKREEDAAAARRRELDAAIAARVAAGKSEGSVTEKTDGYKVTVTASVLRKVTDIAKLQADWSKLPTDVQAAFRWKPEIATAEFKRLDPKLAAIAAGYITTMPASPSLKIEAA